MQRVVVGLGGNLGSREAFVRAAELALAAHPTIEVLGRSALYRTPPLGPPQPEFVNGALLLETTLAPVELLASALAVEADLGRVRTERWGPRTIDVDLLWADQRIATDALTVPHRGLTSRAFALAPLLDVLPELAPEYGSFLAQLGGAPPRWPLARTERSSTHALADAIDEADAFAAALGAALGPAARPVRTVGLVGSALDVARQAGELGRGVTVVIHAIEPVVRATALCPPHTARVSVREVELRGGRCSIAID